MSEPLVSIIIPTYNGEKRIARTLGSIIAQDYANLEIIVVDDVSTDGTVKAARKVLENSGRKFTMLQRKENGGQCAARNTGLEAATGEYVIFFDHDDLAAENFVSVLCGKAQAKKSDIVFCGMKHFYEDEGRYVSETFTLPDNASLLEAWTERRIFFWSVWNFMFRRDFLVNNSLKFTEGCMLGEDTEFVMKALVLTHRVSFVRDELYIYVHHGGQTSKAHREAAMFHAIIMSRFRLGRFIARNTDSPKIREYVLNFYMPDTIVKQFTECAKLGDKERYARLTQTLRHRKIRELLLSSVKFVLKMPELFLKSIILLYAPGLYYLLRKGR
ncbi:MAG: glycosyltransferase family 2 protein [Synergistaceae bacterium]|nr:glycosyltransferase family 2 protein [Synergistaceae bacterium]